MARRKEDLVLNQYENQIAMEVVAPEDIPVGFEGKSTKGLMDISLTGRRYWWLGRYHRRAERICDISVDDAPSLLACVSPAFRTIWGLAVRSSWVWQNYAC